MKDEINRALDQLFEGYIDTPDLQEFREEIFINLSERVQEHIAGGMKEQQALTTALNELGDVTEAADAVSKKKRNEYIGQAYMQRKRPLGKFHAIGYSAAGFVLAFGLVTSISSGISANDIGKIFAMLLPFLVAAAGGFTYLGLTQETRQWYPLPRKRALLYTLAAVLFSFGISVTGMFIFNDVPVIGMSGRGLVQAKFEAISNYPNSILASLVPFVLPALGLLGFLLLTEKDRRKPWVIHQEQAAAEKFGEQFGYLSGALWMCAIALFVLLGFLISWRISWVVFLFATAGQCLLLYVCSNKEN